MVRRFALDAPDFVEPLPDARLKSLIGGMVVNAIGEAFRQAGHVRNFFFRIMRVLIAFSVADVLHQAGDCVAQVQRHRLSHCSLQILLNVAIRCINCIRFWRERQIHSGLRQREVAFRWAKKFERLHRGKRYLNGVRFGQPYVFIGHAHQSARDVQRILAGFEHARQPVKRSIGVRIAHRFMKSRNQVEMLLARFVIGQKLLLQNILEARLR